MKNRERMQRAHIRRAREMYDDPETETPGEFEEFIGGQYADEATKPKDDSRHPSDAVILRYEQRLAKTRKQDQAEQPGLLSKVQTAEKGPYPANPEEDQHLVLQMMKFIHSEELQSLVVEQLKSSKKNIVKSIAEIAANVSGKLIFEIRKQRKVTEPTEAAVIKIALEELWTVAKNLGMKEIPPAVVKNSYSVAQGMFDQIEKQLKTRQTAQPEQAFDPQSQGPQSPEPQQQPPQPQGGMQ